MAVSIMGLYSRLIFPRLCDWSMRNPRMAARSAGRCSPRLIGEILEIGFGTGLNLEHYPDESVASRRLIPGSGCHASPAVGLRESRIDVDLQVQTAEELPFDDERFDCVVSTWTLCSIQEAGRAVSEIRRVLRPGGRFLFLEHGLGDDPGVQRWQRRLTPLQRRVADGCRLDVDIEALVRSGPFQEVRVERFLLEGTPRIVGSMYRGVAVK